jgi:hypothetical protein
MYQKAMGFKAAVLGEMNVENFSFWAGVKSTGTLPEFCMIQALIHLWSFEP